MEQERKMQSYQKHLMEIERQKEVLEKAAHNEALRRQNIIAKQQRKEEILQQIQQATEHSQWMHQLCPAGERRSCIDES